MLSSGIDSTLTSTRTSVTQAMRETVSKDYKAFFDEVTDTYKREQETLITAFLAADKLMDKSEKAGDEDVARVPETETRDIEDIESMDGSSMKVTVMTMKLTPGEEESVHDLAQKVEKLKDAACVAFENAMREVIFAGVHEIVQGMSVFPDKDYPLGEYLNEIRTEKGLEEYSIADFAKAAANPRIDAVNKEQYKKLLAAHGVEEKDLDNKVAIFSRDIMGHGDAARAVLTVINRLDDKIKEASISINDRFEKDKKANAKPKQEHKPFNYEKCLVPCAIALMQLIVIADTQSTDKLRYVSYAMTGFCSTLLLISNLPTSDASKLPKVDAKKNMDDVRLKSITALKYIVCGTANRGNIGGLEAIAKQFIDSLEINVINNYFSDIAEKEGHVDRLSRAYDKAAQPTTTTSL